MGSISTKFRPYTLDSVRAMTKKPKKLTTTIGNDYFHVSVDYLILFNKIVYDSSLFFITSFPRFFLLVSFSFPLETPQNPALTSLEHPLKPPSKIP